jgi:outer membrane protein assembly factor BamB
VNLCCAVNIFISYRRADSSGYAGRIYDRLVGRFGKECVFIDIDTIEAGEDFVRAIGDKVASCDVLIALMGRQWLQTKDERGCRRIDDPRDIVRLEIVSALKCGTLVIPALVAGAQMPRAQELPAVLAPLARQNAIEIHDQGFHESVNRLIKVLEKVGGRGGRQALEGLLPDALRQFVVRRPRLAFASSCLVLASLTLGIGYLVLGPPKNLYKFEEPTATPVKLKTPPIVSALPPILEGARGAVRADGSAEAGGPRHPNVAWVADVTIGDSWSIVGVAGDGTVYVWDRAHEVLGGVRDGKERWAYSLRETDGFTPHLATDGRIGGAAGLRELGILFYVFNSAGDGGSFSFLARVKVDPLFLSDGPGIEPYVCQGASLRKMESTGIEQWRMELDGNCLTKSAAASAAEDVYVSTDAGTIFRISPEGNVRWTFRPACSDRRAGLFVLGDELLVGCDGMLYCVHRGTVRWQYSFDSVSRGAPQAVIVDSTGTIYIGYHRENTTRLLSVSHDGALGWGQSFSSSGGGIQFAFDRHGRLYWGDGRARIVCLAD